MPRQRQPEIGDVVEVVWRDAWSDSTFAHPSEFRDEELITTVGRLIRKTGRVISVSPEWNVDLNNQTYYRGTTHVPRPLVRSIRVIERRAA